MKEAKKILSNGLAAGYAGGSIRKGVGRGGFTVETYHVPEPDGDWSYSYKVVLNEEDIPLVEGKENIGYKNKRVFTHTLLTCSVSR